MDLLLHIGYPKTASTTLQEGIFYNLHESGYINYLGRTLKSTHTRFGFSNFSGHDWIVDLRNEFLFGKKIKKYPIKLRKDVLNVISDEDFTLHPDFHLFQFGVKRNPLDFTRRMKELFGDDVNVTILITIRNQVDLIPSCYIQKYRFMVQDGDYSNFKSFLLGSEKSIRYVTQKVFDFHYVADHYKKHFNSVIKILVFEDLKFDIESFISDLSDILQIDKSIVLSLLQRSHYRNRNNKKFAVHFTSIYKPRGLGKILFNWMGEKQFQIFLNCFWYLRYRIFRQLIILLFAKKQQIMIPDISDTEKEIIREHFASCNKRFTELYGLDEQKMKKYGYFNQ